jgi:hypothetical protein
MTDQTNPAVLQVATEDKSDYTPEFKAKVAADAATSLDAARKFLDGKEMPLVLMFIVDNATGEGFSWANVPQNIAVAIAEEGLSVLFDEDGSENVSH